MFLISDRKTQKERITDMLKLKLLWSESILNAQKLFNWAESYLNTHTHTHIYIYIYIYIIHILVNFKSSLVWKYQPWCEWAIEAISVLQLKLERWHKNLLHPSIGYFIRWLVYLVLLLTEVHNNLSTHWNIRLTFASARFNLGSSVCSTWNKWEKHSICSV
jgi:hypothetical protein